MPAQAPSSAAEQKDSNGRAGNGSGRADHGRAGKGAMERPPAKDGHVQKAAREVAGLKDFQLGDCLGKGAFGSVYRALNWGTGEAVAVKQIRLELLNPSELRVIQLEIDLLKNLNHKNIVKYHGFSRGTDSLYIILEFCENGSLHSICKNFGKFPENLVALYMSQALQGLIYLHEQGVIHRDIKGANILTTKEGLVKLADFGVATKGKEGEASVVGTPYWMAPEVIELSGASPASDVWSLGCTVIELLEGKPPYHPLNPMQALFKIVNDDHPPLPEGASPAVRDFLMQCFQKDPNLRISSKKLIKHPWIVSAKRADAVLPIEPTQYDRAVKSVQQWNEALKSPNNSLRRISRPPSSSPIPPRPASGMQLKTPAPGKGGLAIPKTRMNTDIYRSPEIDTDDNWDDDFATSISPSALQLPHLKPHDNFAGLLSAERLKSYATPLDAAISELRLEDNDGQETVRSPARQMSMDPMETVKLATPIKKNKPEPRRKSRSSPSKQRQASQTKPPALRNPPPEIVAPPPVSKQLPASFSRPSTLFREDSVEDYSDLIAADDVAFQRKLQVMKNPRDDPTFSPKLFHPSDLQDSSRSSISRNGGGSVRRRPTSSEQAKQREGALPRSRSSVEIQKYAEDEEEDFSDIFGKDGSAFRGPDSDSGSDKSTLMMFNAKLSGSWVGSQGDDDDEDDPFAQLEEGLDQMDLESNVARDRHGRLVTLVQSCIGSLKTNQLEETLADESLTLMQVLIESPDLKSVIVSSHGILPILEILETCTRRDVIHQLLRVVNIIIFNDVDIQENLCFIGGIPIISKFAHKKHSSEIRLEAAAFVRQMYQTSTLTLQMFVSCGGLNVLVEFLEEDIETERDLVLIGVNGIWSVFELQGPTFKNDFCRILSRSSVLYPLSLVLQRVLDEDDELAELVEGRIVNIFLLFSQAENHVKETVADRMVLKRVLKDLSRMSPTHQITMLKFFKNLSSLATTHEALQNSNAIEVLIDLLTASMDRPQFREISNQVLSIMYNLCRLSKTRQEDAALNGIIPLLQHIVKTEPLLKEFALPILCDIAHSGKVGRQLLWQKKGLQFYISLLSDRYWQVFALDAIFVWLQEETARVEQRLIEGSFSKAIIDCFVNSDTALSSFENLLEPLQKLLRLSPLVASCLACPEIFSRTAQKLSNKKAVVRLNLLRIIRSICDASEEQGSLIRKYGLYDSIEKLAESDSAVLVREMASELVKSSNVSPRRTVGDSRQLRSRRTSSSTSATMTPPTSLLPSQSMPPTPHHIRASRSTFFERDLSLLEPSRPRTSAHNNSVLTPAYRPVSRDGNSGSSTHSHTSSTGSAGGGAGWGSSGSNPSSGAQKSRLPRTSATRLTRLSTASQSQKSKSGNEENLTPTHTPTSAVPQQSSRLALGPSRRRKTSSALERGFS